MIFDSEIVRKIKRSLSEKQIETFQKTPLKPPLKKRKYLINHPAINLYKSLHIRTNSYKS